MSKKTKIDFSQAAAHIIKTPLENFVEDSYLPYAHYVIMSRALISDDGLKPVQRRILYAMDQLGLTDKKDYIKAAQIVGETMGKYHPHGDSSIGDALARMGQTFSMRVPLVDVQGSVGFTTGDAPAAPRYWEGRPTAAAMELTRDIKDGAIEMGLNYDGKFPEPAMLPIKWPTGIINGSQGIAVGYSSNVISHNPGEVMDALVELIKNPDLTLEELMEIMPGPDMTTGGVLMQYEGVKEYYETGKGTFIIRGSYEITPGMRGTHVITFSEAPYQVSAEQIVKAIDAQKKKDNLKEISFIKDLSDIDNGFKLSIGVKAGANPEVVLKNIFRWTPLEQTFPANMNVLKYGVPQVTPMLTLLKDFIEFRSECIVNKTKVRLDILEKQIERLSGIIAVLLDIDKAIKIIRNAQDDKIAGEKLQKGFKINSEQSDYILSMPLRRLTKSDSIKIKEQIQELQEENERLNKLLSDEKAFNEYMIEELLETKKIIDDPRRTIINTMTEEEMKLEADRIKKAAARVAKNTECYITLFADGNITRTVDPYKQERSPVPIITQVRTRTKEKIIFVSRNGGALKIPASYIPEGIIIEVSKITGLPENSVVGIGRETMDEKSHGILMATTDGGVNIVNGGYSNSDEFQIIKLNKDEEVLYAFWIEKENIENQCVVLISSEGYAANFPLEQVRTSNAGAGTIIGMNIDKDVKIVGASVAQENTGQIVSCTYNTIKVTNLTEISSRNRGAKGVILQRLSKDEEVLFAFTSDKIIANKNGRNLGLPDATERTLKGTKRNVSDILLGHHNIY